MNLFLWLLFIVVAIVSFAPLAYLKVFDANKRYHTFKYVSILLALWTVQTWLRLVVTNPYLIYYLGLNLYPLVMAIVSLLLVALLNYLGRPPKAAVKWFLFAMVVADLVISNTNVWHHWMWQLDPSPTLTYLDTINAQNGPVFMIHTVANYVLLVYIVILLVNHLYKNVKREHDIFPFIFVTIGILLGLVLNLIHIFVFRFEIDPTYVAFAVLIFLFYFVLVIRDIKLILVLGRNDFILDNLREMYVIVNQRDEIIDASEEFVKSFDVDLDAKILFNDLLERIVDKARVFTDPGQLKGPFQEKKRYLHMQMKDISLPLFKYTGKFYLFYDETEHQKYINDMNYIKSHDLMTGLYNRNHFEEIKEQIDQETKSYALIMFDLDGLKLYNDYLGHAAGDQLLIDFANKLKTVAKTYDLIPIRMGGDEFLLIAMAMNSKMVDKAMDDILDVLEHQGTEDTILFSYGYAEREAHSEKLERVLSRADDLMYLMKDKNKVAKEELEKALETRACRIQK